MKTAAAIALFAGSAAAFAPARTGKVSTALAGSFDSELGAIAPPGSSGAWDPLGLLDGADQARFDRLRFVEIKNGRVAMMAALGYATTWSDPARFPGCENFPAGHKAVLAIPPVDLLLPIFAICGFLELAVFKQKEGSFPGDMGGGMFPVGFGPYARDEEDEMDLRLKELNNGRAAMMGWLGMLVHEQINDKPFIFFDKFEVYAPVKTLI